jgi:hypothetical protein
LEEPERALSLPPWFGPHAILEAVERLVVNDDSNKADAGWTLEQINKCSTWQQPEVVDDATLRVELRRLVQMGDLKVVGVGREAEAEAEAEEEHYTLSPPYLPPWFYPHDVVETAVTLDEEDDEAVGGGGSTWEEIRDDLKDEHQPEKPLPPEFDTVLRALLSVLHQRGHLSNTNTKGGVVYYSGLHAPVLSDPIRNQIPQHLWFYYLGYRLGAGDALEDGSDDPAAGEQIRWLGPRSVLEELEQLDTTTGGWTLEEIRDALKRRYQQQQDQLPAQSSDDDTATELLQATLIRLRERGYLTRLAEGRYKLSMITPPSFPSWFRPKAVLEAVDDAGGSTSFGQIMASLATKHSKHTQVPGFDSRVLLRTTLSVLHQRGYLTCSGQPPEQHYTRRRQHAPDTADDIHNDLLSYYVGYKLGRGYGLDDDGTAESEGDAANQLRRRFGDNDKHPESEVVRYSICLYFISVVF